MKLLLSILLLSTAMQAQELSVSSFALPNAPRQHATSQRPFWTGENMVDSGILASLITADAVTTQRGLSEGLREANPVMRPFVTRGAAGEAAGSAVGFGAGLGVAYVLHRGHHYRAERVAMRMMIVGESGFVANNMIAIR